jgi:hypothetical protein
MPRMSRDPTRRNPVFTACGYRGESMSEKTQTAPRRLLHKVGWALLGGALLLLLLLGLALSAALQSEPRVMQTSELSANDVARAMTLLRTHDPRRAYPGVVSTAQVAPRDVEVLISHGTRRWLSAASQFELQRGSAQLVVSLRAPAGPVSRLFGNWLNVELLALETGGLPVLDSVRVGSLRVPTWLAERLALRLALRAGLSAELDLLAEVVRRVRFRPEHMLITYAWQRDSAGRLFAGLVPAEELARLRPYAERLTQFTQSQNHWLLPMVELVPPLFELAQTRTRAGGDAALENRAALTVLTLFANGRHVGSVVPLARTWPRPRPIRLTLSGRPDFPLHFLVSAALASETTGVLSQAIGLYKEITDAKSGSGFSFNDMAANRAGTRFGERLLREPQLMQQRLAAGVAETDLIPPVADLPEFLPEAEFMRRFGGVGAPAYNALMADIENRVAALPLLQ